MRVKIKGNTAMEGIQFIPVGGYRLPRKESDPAGTLGEKVNGRFISVHAFKEFEVLDQDDDPPPVVQKIENGNGSHREELFADPDRMGRKAYAEILASPGAFSIVGTEGVDSTLSRAAIESAKAEAARLSSDLVNANIEIATLKAQNAQLAAALALAQATAPAPALQGKKTKGKEDRAAT
jgi:hypothetical protein